MTDPTSPTTTVSSTGYTYNLEREPAPPTDEQIQQTAQEILDTGSRPIIADDYDSRAVRFGEEMAKLEPADQARLVQELLKRDSGALNSWMKLDIVDRMQNEGRISQGEYEAIASGFVQAYNTGAISQDQAETFLQTSALQNVAPGIASEQFAQMREFLAAAGTSTEAQAFRENFAEQLLTRSLGQGAPWAFHAPGLAMQIAADSGDPNMAARVFNDVLEANGGTEETRAKLLDAIGQSSIGFRNSQGAAEGAVNPLVTLIDSVAAQPDTAQWNATAVAIAKYAETSSDDVFFDYSNDDKPFTDTAQALSTLLGSGHGDAILSSLANWSSAGVAGGGGHAQEFGRNAIELGNLMRITAFNPDNPQSAQAMQTIQSWAQMRKDYLNGVQRDDYPADMTISTARQDLGMLGGAAFDAVQQMKIDQDNRTAATQALVGFAVDLALTVVPGGGKLSALAATDLKNAFGNNATIDRVIDQALSGGDQLSAAAVTQLKADITKAVGEDQADLEALRLTASNFVTESIVAGLPEGTQADGGQSHRDIVEGHVQNVQDDIQDNRNK